MICKISIFLFFLFYILFSLTIKQTPPIKKCNNNHNERLCLTKYNSITFIFFNYQLYYSNKYELAKISYNIQCLDEQQNKILPSDLALYYDLHILCYLKINSVNIYSIAIIEKDSFFKCLEFLNPKKINKIGIIIYKTSGAKIIENSIIYLIEKNFFNIKIQVDDLFDPSKIYYDYKLLLFNIQNNRSLIKTKRLKKLYISQPFISLKTNLKKQRNKWNFINIFNEYFCFCKGNNCLNIMIDISCKYFFYIYLIDINQNIYKKTDFLLMDFILKQYSSDDVFPIFEEMINRKLNAHYITEKEEIYKKYCMNNKYCNLILLVNSQNYKINGDFLEKHFTLILKLRQVLSSVGVNINIINNLFYNIDYITYICVGHGVSYFKYYLYASYYGPQNFDKLLIPDSKELINITLKYGWKEENLIKFNLPRWEKYNLKNISLNENGKIKTNSIFIMFTWRQLNKKRNISSYYIHNILYLLNNNLLINNLLKNNLTLYFTLHHSFAQYRDEFKINQNIIYIEENEIAECLSKTNLIVTDYSSIIFDIIYRRKPFIIYIPDINDPMNKENYKNDTYNIINNFANHDFKFENIFFDVNSTIGKINYYINNKFQLEEKLIQFYDLFNFNNNKNINDFLNYILKF